MNWQFILLVLLTYLQYVHGQRACTDAQPLGNVSYSYHESDCNQYRQCHKEPTTDRVVVVYRHCPFGYYWDQGQLDCEIKTNVNCPIERCISGTDHTRIESSGCRAYWECAQGAFRAACCPPGQRYVNDEGCVTDFTCMDPCPGPCGENPVCRSFPHWERLDYYYKMEVDGNNYERICPQGTNFDILECGCVETRGACSTIYSLDFSVPNQLQLARSRWLQDNVNVLSGAAQLTFSRNLVVNATFPESSLTTPHIIRLRYREIYEYSDRRTLVFSQDCKRCHVLRADLVRFDPNFDTFQVTLTKFEKTVAQVTVTTEGFNQFDWKEAVIIYNGREIVAIVRSNDITYMKRTDAPKLRVMDCGLSFSAPDFRTQFIGEINYLSVYSCDSGGSILNVLP